MALLAVSNIVLVILTWNAWGAPAGESSQAVDIGPSMADLRLPAESLVDRGISQEVLARPLFSSSRRPFLPPPPVVQQNAEASTLPAPASPDLVVDGIWLQGNVKRAHLKRSGDDPGEWRLVGDIQDGWRVTAITASNVTLMLDGQSVTLELYPSAMAGP
jgi:hypothetical protein